MQQMARSRKPLYCCVLTILRYIVYIAREIDKRVQVVNPKVDKMRHVIVVGSLVFAEARNTRYIYPRHKCTGHATFESRDVYATRCTRTKYLPDSCVKYVRRLLFRLATFVDHS
jgi:hypothetical protein